MFSDISVFKLLIYAAGVGFAAAIIYTNLQRTALSKFINHLIDNCCLSEQTAAELSSMGLSGIQKKIIISALKKQYGLKRCVKCLALESEAKSKDVLFEKSDSSKYYLCDSDTEQLKKKYSYKTMPKSLVALLIAALAAVVIAVSLFAEWFISSITIPKIEDTKTESEQVQEEIQQNINNDSSPDNQPSGAAEDSDSEKPSGPRIPV